MTTTSNFLKKHLFYWVPVYIYMILIFYLSSQSIVPTAGAAVGSFIIPNYVKHFFEYFILSLLVYRGFNNSKFKKNSKILAFALSGLYSISDEIHQFFIPGRQFSLFDIGVDLAGIVTAILIYKKFIQKS